MIPCHLSLPLGVRKVTHRVVSVGELALPLIRCSTWESRS